MPAIETYSHRSYAASKFIEGLSTTQPRSDNNLYLYVAKTTPWNDDTLPPYPSDTTLNHGEVWQNIMHLKRISASDCILVIQRHDWKSGTVYQQYTDDVELFDPTQGLKPFYVITTPELNVYKCLFNNNGGPSFIKPTGISTNIISTLDRYFWKYMFTVNTADAQKFLTNEFIPVRTLKISDNSKQWDVQQNAVDGSIDVIQIVDGGSGYVLPPAITITGSGSSATANCQITNGKISQVNITNRGTGYSFATVAVVSGEVTLIGINNPGTGYVSAPAITITGGGGSGATALATVVGGSLTAITITDPGSGYTSAPTVGIGAGSGTQATASAVISTPPTLKAIISPPGGHGSDAVSELGGYFALVSGELQFEENGKFTIANDFRQFGLILNPTKANTIPPVIGTASTYTQALSLNLTSVTGSFSADEQVFGSESGASGITLDYDAGVLRLVNVLGTFQPGENVANLSTSKTGLLEAANGTAQGGGTLQFTLDASDPAASDDYVGFTVFIEGQERIISANNSATKIATVTEDWTTTPDGTSVYSIANISYPELKPNSGYMLYINNQRPFERNTNQLERIRMFIQF